MSIIEAVRVVNFSPTALPHKLKQIKHYFTSVSHIESRESHVLWDVSKHALMSIEVYGIASLVQKA